MKKQWIDQVFSDTFLLRDLDVVYDLRARKEMTYNLGLECDIRLLLRRAMHQTEGVMPEREWRRRVDIHVSAYGDLPEEWIEIKSYDYPQGPAHRYDFMKDFKKLFILEGEDLKTFIYFGLYPNPAILKKEGAHDPNDRKAQIDAEITYLNGLYESFSAQNNVVLVERETVRKPRDNMTIYAHWHSFRNS